MLLQFSKIKTHRINKLRSCKYKNNQMNSIKVTMKVSMKMISKIKEHKKYNKINKTKNTKYRIFK